MTPNALNYRLIVRGLFGRNRTSHRESYDLFKHVDINKPKTLEELRPLMTAKLAEIKAKPGCEYRLREDPVLVETRTFDGKTYESESFMMLSEKVLLEGVVGGEEKVL